MNAPLNRFLLLMILMFNSQSAVIAQQPETLESLSVELEALEAKAPEIAADKQALDRQRSYVDQLLELRERILALEAVEQDAPDSPDAASGAVSSSSEHVLLLSSAVTAKPVDGGSRAGEKYEFSVSQEPPGISVLQAYDSANNGHFQSQRSTGFNEYPISIRLGEPFSYAVSLRAESERTKRYCLGIEKLEVTALTHVGRADMTRSQMVKVPYPVFEKIEFKCEEVPGGHYPLLESVHLSGEHDLKIQCEPAADPKETDYLYDYPYQCRYQSSVWGQSDYWPTFSILWPKVEMQTNGHFLGENNIEWNAQLVMLNGLGGGRSFNDKQESVLRYMPNFQVRGELQASSYAHPFALREQWQHPDQHAPHNEADETAASDSSGQHSSDDLGADPLANGEPDGAENPAVNNPASGPDQAQDEATLAATQSNDPSAQDPDSVQIAGLIREWVGASEPVVNVQHGHSFKFEKWGRLVGTNVDGGEVSVRQRPDDVGAQSDTKYLWAKRTQLLSANNCSLQAFVMHRLQVKALSECQGKYGPILPDLSGKSIADAKRKLTALKLKVKQVPGDPAPSKKLSMTVQQQQQKPGSELTQGELVELKLYLPYIEKVIVPKLIGKSSGDAQANLKKLGLLSRIELGAPAPSERLAGSVAAQNLQAGAKTKKGTLLELTVHGPYSANTSLPSVVGMPVAKAKQIIEFAGYAVSLKVGKKTASASLLNTIEKQIPPAGITLKKGSKVALYSYSSNAQQAQVGSYIGLSVSDAQHRVASDGLKVSMAASEQAPDQASAGKVFKQTPPPGIKIKAGGRVTLRAYGDYLLTLGDYRQLASATIARDLRADGLRVNISQARVAPSKNLNGVVFEQSPRQGSKVKKGSTVSLLAYSDYVAAVNVPNVNGLNAAQATQRLAALGLTVQVQTGGSAPSAALANSVIGTLPGSGAQLAAGGRITVSVYGAFTPPSTVTSSARPASETGLAGANSFVGDWQGNLTLIDAETGEVDDVFPMWFKVSESGSLHGKLDFGENKSARLVGTANAQQVRFIGTHSYTFEGQAQSDEYRFSGKGSANKITGQVDFESMDLSCLMGNAFGSLNLDVYNPNPAKHVKKDCPDIPETQNWQASRTGGSPSQVNRQQLEEEIYRAQLFKELLVSKQQIDRPNVCGSQRAEASRTKQELLALNQRYQGQATQEYRTQAEGLKQANKDALNQYYACFANSLRSYSMVAQAGITDYRQHSQAYSDLSQEFANVAELDQFIQQRQRQL